MHCNSFERAARAWARGFTLIEVMIVVAIVAILASVAYPAYTDYIRRGQLQEAFTNLANYRIRMEQYYQDNRRYTEGAAANTCRGAAAEELTAAELGGATQFFTYSCVPSDNGQAYILTATGSGGNTNGYTYTINQDGARATTVFAGTAVNNVTCWASKSTSACN
ncbi:prepilin-type N-terminal cleavage/methylation domain-containing protein [Aquabacterium fontiphilum]|jgi:type IV pilus assembly protein PilE|uniref:type IV pilin protein n=1 Tax=Aquabacterium fontiphilum TaxID=450365 RepID=UPI001376FAB1|nr:prepilin-type N-terminal cleavage/methylation domain-containing protein [Aquabacterium fontiphilum]